MMPRFPGLSRPDGLTISLPVDWYGPDGNVLNLGHGPNTEPRVPWNLPKPRRFMDFGDLSLGGVTPDSPAPVQGNPNVIGASRPDLIVVPGSASGGGGGVTVGSLALLALLAVGGWWLYKRMKGRA